MPYKRVEISRPIGVVSDLSPYELPNEVFSDGRNVTFNNFRTSVSAGYTQVFPTTTIKPLFMQPWTDFITQYWFYASENKIYRTEGSSELDVTNISGDYNATFDDSWTGTNFNGALIMNNKIDAPQYFNVSSVKMEDLIDWPADTQCAVVRGFKNYLVALDITKSSVNFENMVKWSDSTDVGGIPVSWDETDPASDAGENILPDSGGRIIDGLALADSFMIYKSDSIWAMNFVAGTFIFNFRKVFTSGGALSQDCVVEFEGKHFVVGANDIYIHDGNTKKSIIDNKVKENFYGQVNSAYIDKVKAVGDPKNKEIWVYFPSSNSENGFADQALIYNYSTDTWVKREIPLLTHISNGVVNPQEDDTWDSSTVNWDNDNKAWGTESFNPTETTLLLADYTNNKFYEGNTTRTFNGVQYTGFVERIGIDFGDDNNYKYINSITPHFSGEGTIDIYVGTEDRQGEGVTWSDPVSFTVGDDYKADFRNSGRYIAVRFESTSDNLWSLTGYTIEYKSKGRR